MTPAARQVVACISSQCGLPSTVPLHDSHLPDCHLNLAKLSALDTVEADSPFDGVSGVVPQRQALCATSLGMAVSESDVKKAFRSNNFRISDAAVASRIATLADDSGFSADELSDAYDAYIMNRRDSAVLHSRPQQPAALRTQP